MKKANKTTSIKKPKSAQKRTKKTSERSSRASAKKTAVARAIKEKPSPSALPQQGTAQEVESPKQTSSLGTNLLRVAVLVVVIGITIYIYSIRDRVEEFAALGYPGIFLIALLANATILLPAPGVAIVYAMGAIFNPIGVGLAAGTGGAIGELSGYLAGFSGQAVVENTVIFNRIKPWVDKYGAWAILVLGAFPNPFFDTAGIAAGIAKMPMWRFLFFCWIGQLIKMTLFAVAGYYSLEWFSNFFSR